MKENIYILIQNRVVYLVNTTTNGIKELVYSTGLFLTLDGENVPSSTPSFQIENLPAKSYMKIEEIDPYEDGEIWYQLEKVLWDNWQVDENITHLNKKELWGGDRIDETLVTGEIKRLI